MFHMNDYLAKKIADRHVVEMERRLETWRLLREAGIDQHGWVLCLLGRLLVALGRRLERHGLPPAVSMEGQVTGGR